MDESGFSAIKLMDESGFSTNQINGWKLCNMDDHQQKSSIILHTCTWEANP
jgi:hypothetical protein